MERKVAELSVELAPLAATLLQKTWKSWKSSPTSALTYAAVSISWVCVVAFRYFHLLNDRNLQLMSSLCSWPLVSGPSYCPAVRWSCCTHSCLPAPRLKMIKCKRKRANCDCVGKHFSLRLNVCLRSKSRTAPDTKNSQTTFYQVLKSLVDGMGCSWSYSVFYNNLSWDAALPVFLEAEHLAFFCMWFMEESTGSKIKGDVSHHLEHSCPPASHIAHEIPERISGMLEYSILLKIAAEWLIPDKRDRSSNNEVLVCRLILVPKTWNGMMIELLIKYHNACQNTERLLLFCLETSCSDFYCGANYNIFMRKKRMFELL